MFVMFMVGVSLYSSTVLIPQFLQEIMGYSAEQAGMAVSSGGLALMFLFPVAGALAPKFDPRVLVACGFTITTFGLYRMTGLNLNVPFGMAVSWRVVIALGLPFLFIPINTLCYAGIPQEKYNEVSGMSALMRNLGGSVGISFVTTLLARLTQKHQAMLVADTVSGNGPFDRMKAGLISAWMHNSSGASADAAQRAGAQIYGMAQIQARLLVVCRCRLGDGRIDRTPDTAAVPDEAAKEARCGPNGALRTRFCAHYWLFFGLNRCFRGEFRVDLPRTPFSLQLSANNQLCCSISSSRRG